FLGAARRISDDQRLTFDVLEPPAASGSDRTLHRPLVEQRKPLAIEASADASLIARLAEPAPVVVNRIGAAPELRQRLLVRLDAVGSGAVTIGGHSGR